jgi:predicted membrane channel-forming protein YqfA (hemolysin III family)
MARRKKVKESTPAVATHHSSSQSSTLSTLSSSSSSASASASSPDVVQTAAAFYAARDRDATEANADFVVRRGADGALSASVNGCAVNVAPRAANAHPHGACCRPVPPPSDSGDEGDGYGGAGVPPLAPRRTTTTTTTTTTAAAAAAAAAPPSDGEWLGRRDSDHIDVSADVRSLPAHSIMSPQLGSYLAACRVYSVEPDPGAAMVFDNLRRTTHLAINPDTFHPLGMLPLCEVLKENRTILSLDLSRCAIGSNGCYVLQALLERNNTLRSLELRYCGIDFRGATALARVASAHPSIRCLNLRGNDIGEAGAAALVSMVKRNPRILELDVSNNCVGTVAVERLFHALTQSPHMTIELGGNYVREEVLNAITHGVGLIAFSVAGWILVAYARKVSTAYYVSAQIYAWSLVFMYASSTACHSTFMLPITGAVCRALDHCSIYLLIAGTFTPICAVTLGHTWSGLIALIVVWVVALVGITVTLAEATAGPSGPSIVHTFTTDASGFVSTDADASSNSDISVTHSGSYGGVTRATVVRGKKGKAGKGDKGDKIDKAGNGDKGDEIDKAGAGTSKSKKGRGSKPDAGTLALDTAAAAAAAAVAAAPRDRSGQWTVWLALGQGWCGLLVARQAHACLPAHGSMLLGLGGIAYTIGVVFFIKGETRAIYCSIPGFVNADQKSHTAQMDSTENRRMDDVGVWRYVCVAHTYTKNTAKTMGTECAHHLKFEVKKKKIDFKNVFWSKKKSNAMGHATKSFFEKKI